MKWLICRALAFRFDADKADGLDATFELRIGAGRRVQRYAVAIAERACRVTPGAAPDAGASATIAFSDMLRLAAGTVGWPELLSTGRLQLAGDPFLALRLPSLFGMPVARRREQSVKIVV